MKHTFWLLLWLSLITIAVTPIPSAAQQSNRITIDARVGFDNMYTADAWTPVTLTVRGDNQDRTVIVEWVVTDDQGSHVMWDRELNLPAQTTKEITTNLVMSGYARSIVARIQSDNRILASTLINAQASSEQLNVVVSNDANLLQGLNDVMISARTNSTIVVVPPSQMPTQSIALQGIYNIFIDNPASLNEPQHHAIQLWMELGGHVIVADNVSGILAQNSELTLNYANPYTVQLPSDVPTVFPANITVPSVSLPTNTHMTEVHPGSGLLWQRSVGRGTFYQSTLPLNALRDWNGLAWLWEPALEPVYPDIRSVIGRPNISVQQDPLGNSLNIAALNKPHPLTIFLIILGYVILVGPVTYTILKRWYTLDWAWVSIPAVALTITVILSIIGLILRGNNTLIYTLSIVQQRDHAQYALVSDSTSLYTPFRDIYQATISDADGIIPIQDSEVIAGLRFTDDKNAQMTLTSDIGSIQYIHAHRMIAAPLTITHNISATPGSLNGTISINGVDLYDVVVFYDSKGQFIGNVTSAQPFTVAIDDQTSSFPCDIIGNTSEPLDQRRLYGVIAGSCNAVTALPLDRIIVYGWSNTAQNPPTFQSTNTTAQRQLYVVTINLP